MIIFIPFILFSQLL